MKISYFWKATDYLVEQKFGVPAYKNAEEDVIHTKALSVYLNILIFVVQEERHW